MGFGTQEKQGGDHPDSVSASFGGPASHDSERDEKEAEAH